MGQYCVRQIQIRLVMDDIGDGGDVNCDGDDGGSSAVLLLGRFGCNAN